MKDHRLSWLNKPENYLRFREVGIPCELHPGAKGAEPGCSRKRDSQQAIRYAHHRAEGAKRAREKRTFALIVIRFKILRLFSFII
jgi:hypothetical protein